MTTELIAILDGREMGRIVRDKRARLTFTYNEEWRTTENAYPLSISMPLALAQHGQAKIDPFLWGLLPDNQMVLDQWAKKFHVSARNAFSLISAVGEDCAGAVQFVRPERLAVITGAAQPEIEWLDEADIAQRLRALREDHSAWRIPRDTGQFSLAGAQPKTALLLENGRWGLPSGRVPTTLSKDTDGLGNWGFRVDSRNGESGLFWPNAVLPVSRFAGDECWNFVFADRGWCAGGVARMRTRIYNRRLIIASFPRRSWW